MNRRFILLIVVLLLTRYLITIPVFSQEIYDPEAEYARIKAIAFGGDYITAAADARELVKRYPSYGDARILLGRILSWQKDFANAGAVIDTLLISEPDNVDALSAKGYIMLWSKDNTPVSTGLRAGYSFDNFSVPYNRFWQVFNSGVEHRFSWGTSCRGNKYR